MLLGLADHPVQQHLDRAHLLPVLGVPRDDEQALQKRGAVARLLGDALRKPLVAGPSRIATLARLEPVGLQPRPRIHPLDAASHADASITPGLARTGCLKG